MDLIRAFIKDRHIASFLTLAFVLVVQVAKAQLPAVSFQQLKRDEQLFSSLYITIEEDQNGFIWFGSANGGGLYRYDGYQLKTFVPEPNQLKTSIAGTRISRIINWDDHQIIVGTYFGFSTMDLFTGQIKSYNNRYQEIDAEIGGTLTLLKDTVHDVLWIGTYNGLAKMIPEDEASFTVLKLDTALEKSVPKVITRILPDPKDPNLLWLGTTKGLFTYNIHSGSHTLILCPDISNPLMNIEDLFIDANKVIWLSSTEGAVLAYHTVTGKWTVLQVPESVAYPNHNKLVFKMLPTDQPEEFWISTQTGVGKMNIKTGQVELWEHDESRPDGLLPNGAFVEMLNDRHGRLWVASWHGVQYARQAFMHKSNSATNLRVAITEVTVAPAYDNGPKPLIYTEALILKKDQRDITFHFVLPNPLDPTAVTYQYRLSGFDDDWITTDQRSVRYPNLGGGDYTFEIRAKEGNSESWVPDTTLDIHIQKQASEFWWFWFIAGISILGIVISLYRFLVTRAKKEERLKAEFEHQLSEIQMQALRAQMNPHFLFNSLNSIKYYAISKSKEETAAYVSKFALLVRSILNNSKSRTISLKDELDALQLYIEIEHLRLDGKFDYLFEIDSGIHIRQAQIPPMILQPYVENAIWHGLMHKDGKGKLLVQVKEMGHQIQCVIEDNGIGRARAAEIRKARVDHKQSVGMQITEDRIALINRIYRIDTQVHVIDLADADGNAMGTRVVINVPLIRDEEE